MSLSTTRRRQAGTIAALALTLASASCGSDPAAPTDPIDPGPQNAAPVARAGADQDVSAGLAVGLDGTGSTDTDGDALTYAWTFSSRPGGSQAAFEDPTSAQPRFTPDVDGAYVVSLVVNDGTTDSPPDEITITAADNTARKTIGAGGGTIASVDGHVTLEVPAGALGADEEITMTLATVSQYPAELADLGDAAVVYEFGPDGLQFAVPALVTVVLADATAPGESGGTLASPLAVVASLSGGTVEILGGQVTSADPTTGALTASAEVGHFSSIIADELRITDGSDRGKVLTLSANRPADSYAKGESFTTTVRLRADRSPISTLSATLYDGSSGSVEAEWLLAEMDQEADQSRLSLAATVQHECVGDGLGQWAVSPTATLSDVHGFGEVSGGPFVGTLLLESDVDCVEPVPTFNSFSAFAGEMSTYVLWETAESDRLMVTRGNDGPIMIDHDGGAGPEVISTAQAVYWFSGLAAATDGIIAVTDGGLFAYEGPLIETPGSTAPLAPIPTFTPGPDLTQHATDVVHTNDNPFNSWIVTTIFGDQNLAFFQLGSTLTGGTPGFVLDDSYAETFKDANGSVFGDDLPVTSHVGPNGFTSNDPMLVATVAGDGSGVSELLLLELVSGKAVATPVTNIVPAPEVRRLRCLMGVCALSAYGTGFGFGGLTIFLWDGQSGFTPVSGHVQRGIGLDMVMSGPSSVLVASVNNTGNAYWIDEVTTTGDVLRSEVYPVPEGCSGPSGVVLRSLTEVILTCNGSGLVVADNQFSQN